MEWLKGLVVSEKIVTKKNALIFVVGLLVGVLGLVLLSPETRIEIRLGRSTHASDSFMVTVTYIDQNNA